MKRYSAWEKTQVFGEYKTLEPGGYVVGIVRAYEEKSRTGKAMLTLDIDVAEGDQRGIFNGQKTEDKGWPNAGKYRIMLPETDSPDDLGLRRLKTVIKIVEESNTGYVWGWDEATLRGKKIGTLWRKEEYIGNDGNSHWSTRICAIVPAEKIRTGDFQVPKDKPLEEERETQQAFAPAPQAQDPFSSAEYQQPSYQQQSLAPGGFTPVDPSTEQDPDLPF